MDSEAAFLEAAVPEPVILLRQQLLPYSLGHDILLHRAGSPFVTRVAVPDLDDLYLAVLVCCQTYKEAMATWRLPEEEWREKLQRWKKLVGPVSTITAMEMVVDFQKYIADGCKCPRFREVLRAGQGARRRPGANWRVILMNCLTGDLNWTREEALNEPLAAAQWAYCAWWERKGTIHLATEDARERQRVQEEADKQGWRVMKFKAGAQVVDWKTDQKLRREEESRQSSVISNQSSGTRSSSSLQEAGNGS